MSKQSAAAFAASVAHSVSISALLPASGGVEVFRKVRDVDNDCNRVYFTAYDSSLQELHAPVEVSKFAMQHVSPSGRVTLRAFNGEKNNEDKPVLEVLVGGSLALRVDASEVHGKVMADDWLGGGGFSRDDKYFTYIAATKAPKPTTHFDKNAESASKYDYKEDWGELYNGVSSLCVYVLELSTGEVKPLEGMPAQDTPAQPSFVGDRGVIYTAYNTVPKRLGLVYCQQRRCSLKLASNPFTGSTAPIEDLTSSQLSIARSARVAPSGRHIVFLGSARGFDTHGGAMQLYMLSVPASSCDAISAPVLLLDTVTTPYHTLAPASFPGIYCGVLHAQPFLSDTSLIVESQWRSCTALLVVDIVDAAAQVRLLQINQNSCNEWMCSAADVESASPYRAVHPPLSSPDTTTALPCPPSNALLAVSDSRIAVLHTPSPISRPVLLLVSTTVLSSSQIPVIASATFSPMAVTCLNQQHWADYRSALSHMSSRLMLTSVPCADEAAASSGGATDTIESILLLPPSTSSTSSIPLVLVPHGGPHSAFSTSYIPQYTFLSISLGAAVLMVNYRGSTVPENLDAALINYL